MRKNIFLTFEGVDGCGKSTHSKLLADYLRRKGYQVVHTREPGGVSIAESLREILLHPKMKISPLTELLLYLAARAQHIEELIRPALSQSPVTSHQSTIVICERFSDATFAYQGYGRKIDFKLLKKLDALARQGMNRPGSYQGIKPDLTILLDLPIRKRKTLAHRSFSGGGDRLENESLSFYQRVRHGYLKLAKQEPKRFRLIKVNPLRRTIEETQKEIRKVVDEFLTHTWARKSN